MYDVWELMMLEEEYFYKIGKFNNPSNNTLTELIEDNNHDKGEEECEQFSVS